MLLRGGGRAEGRSLQRPRRTLFRFSSRHVCRARDRAPQRRPAVKKRLEGWCHHCPESELAPSLPPRLWLIANVLLTPFSPTW